MRLVPAATVVRRPGLLIGLMAILGAAVLAGCGGGGGDDDPSEDALRSRLAAAFKKTDDARSIRTLDSFEVDGGDGETVSGCIDISIEQAPGGDEETESFALQSHVDDCEGPVSGEMVLVGLSLWVSSGDGSFRPAGIDPALVPELTEEGIDFGDLPSVASDVELADPPSDSSADDAGPTYGFEAPASALSEEIGADSTDLDFTATTDSRGYLTGLVAQIEIEDATGTVEQTYEEIGRVPTIQPPPKRFVHGRPVRVETKGDLERLLSNIVPEAL